MQKKEKRKKKKKKKKKTRKATNPKKFCCAILSCNLPLGIPLCDCVFFQLPLQISNFFFSVEAFLELLDELCFDTGDRRVICHRESFANICQAQLCK